MTAEADEPRKRRKYTTAERLAVLKAADKVGPVEAARQHGVPQTTVSNWLHRDATKVASEVGAKEVGARADESKPTRTRRAATSTISKALVGSTVESPPRVESPPTVESPPMVEPPPTVELPPTVERTATKPTAPKAATPKATATKAAAAKAAKPTTMLPKPGTPLPNSLVKRVARSYTPSEKAQALEHAAAHGVSAASDTFNISRFSIYDWQRKLKKAAAGEGPSPTSGPSPQTIEEQRDQEILGEWRKHPGLGPSQIRNQLRRRGGKPERVMHDRGSAFWSWAHGNTGRASRLSRHCDPDRGRRRAHRRARRPGGRRPRAPSRRTRTSSRSRDPAARAAGARPRARSGG